MIVVASVSAAVAACSPHRVIKDPPPPVEVAKTYRGGSDYDSRAPMGLPERWWRDFKDRALNRLVELSLRDSLQIRAAWARVKQARAVVIQANSGKFPQLDATASAGRQRQRFSVGGSTTTQTSNLFSASIAAGYEVDLWRRLANGGNAAALDALAIRDDFEAIAISLAAEVTETWFDILAQRAQRKLIEEQLETNKTYFDLVQLRFQKGLASALDVHQQRQQLVTTRSQLALIDSSIRLLDYRLAILIGVTPGKFDLTERSARVLPDMPQVPGTGLPAHLLERRPDVRAARRRVEAADYRVAVAVANRLPSLRLSGSTSLQSSSVTDFIASPLWSLLASITGPLFDGGRRKAEVVRQKAVVEERLMNYGQVLLQAMSEVESALDQEKHQLIYIAELEESVAIAGDQLREAQARYRQGLIDYLPVLTALQGKQRSELNLLLARRQLLSYRIQLCRALGGTWTQKLRETEREGM